MTTTVAIRTPNEDKNANQVSESTGVFWRQRFPCGWQRYENAKSSDQNDESEGDEKPLINFLGRWAIALAFTATAQLSPWPKFSEATMMLVDRNTNDRSLNKKYQKSPKGTTRPPKMNTK